MSQVKRLLAAMQSPTVRRVIMPQSVSDLINGKAKVLDESKFTELAKVQFYVDCIFKNTLPKPKLCPRGDLIRFVSFLTEDMFRSRGGVSICGASGADGVSGEDGV